MLAHTLSRLFYPRSPRGAEVLARSPPAQVSKSRYSLQPFLLFFPQIKVPLNDFPNMLGLFIGELGEVQLPAHLVAARVDADPVTRSPERRLSRPPGWDAADDGGRAQPHLRGCPYNRAGAELRAGQPAPGSTAAALPGEPARGPAAERGWHGAYRRRGLLASREGGPASFPRGPARGCSRSRPRPPGWGYGRCLLAACSVQGVRMKGEPSNASPGKAGRGLWEGAEHPPEQLCLRAREDRLHRGASCPTGMLCSPARSSVSQLITQILPPPAVSEENLSASSFPPTSETGVLHCSPSNLGS